MKNSLLVIASALCLYVGTSVSEALVIVRPAYGPAIVRPAIVRPACPVIVRPPIVVPARPVIVRPPRPAFVRPAYRPRPYYYRHHPGRYGYRR